MFKFVCVICIYVTLSLGIVDSYGKHDVKKLKTKLFDKRDYDSSIRPIANQSRPIEVIIFRS